MRRENVKEITRDVFDLADRIKEVDEEYRLYYNFDHERYEVRKRGEIAITWTEPLSAALIVKLRETHVRRRTELLREIERAEEQAERDAASRARERLGVAVEGFMSSAWRSR
ncbi:MAG: hypothetical protein IJT69_00055 [Clostridia bacterium]|nr:hypothetical protein [Clostridia bacterium]